MQKKPVFLQLELENIFKSMDDKYMQERAVDMVDIGNNYYHLYKTNL